MGTFTVHTRSGIRFNAEDPRADQVDFADIAASLGKLCRFNGHTDKFYSWAEHSYHLSHLVDDGDALGALLHDAYVAYIGPSPIVALFPQYEDIRTEVRRAIAEAAGIKTWKFITPSVIEWDRRILHAEVEMLMPLATWHDRDLADSTLTNFAIEYWDHREASRRWHGRLLELAVERCTP